MAVADIIVEIFRHWQEGLEFIQQISKHLPKDLAGKTRSVTSSFQRLLHILDETKRICVPESNNNHIARRSISTGSSNEPIEQSYESKNLTADAVTNPMYINIDERKPINIPPDKTTDDYLAIQGNNSITVPAYTHTPCIRVNVSVNNKLKGLYYCLIEDGILFLDRNTNAEHSEYVISLAEYTFKAVNNFTIKLTKNELEIALLFSAKIDCDTWMECLTTARDSVYSYVPIQETTLTINQTPKRELDNFDKEILRCRSVEDTLASKNTESSSCVYVDVSPICLENAQKALEKRAESDKIRKSVNDPLFVTKNDFSSETLEEVRSTSYEQHLPEDLTEKPHSVTLPFQGLTRKPINIPPDKTTDDYLVIQENNRNTVPAYTHTPCIRVNVTVNNKLKGLYYCLIEDGILFLDKNTNAEHSEYVISLGEYTFKAINDFTIRLTKNELRIALLFSAKIDCDTWMECLTTVRDSVYSYVPICRGNIITSQSPRVKLNKTNSVPVRKCRSVEDILESRDACVDASPDWLDNLRNAYHQRVESDKFIKSTNTPLLYPKNHYLNRSKEEVKSTSYEDVHFH